MFAQTVFGVWLFLNPLLGLGIAGLKAGPMAPVVSLVRHLAFGLVLAWLYPVSTERELSTRRGGTVTAGVR